ncbi:SIT4 phosphatase-associated protein-domain-containing protein [Microdochium trichocladiopsis]|uniref:SIT4 phosphatase-associated protein-domain-containing protein n=1 Tax=Microdochium trichocladiopsis TaxID=1682393 RepID=A0A9P8Y278_9PEZI|nr:SIT4 phosphatase-associated protein-domain-containing protein [Microdochium trichocladiopsis]KAH7027840.1 SIT4 phosphatase-associated protein-domain-containing protein [Microdochium trichocladiopsis]
MFWRFGGYANISTIDTILDKPDFHLEDLLDESDLIQELKQHNTKLIEYLREDSVLARLLDYVIAPKLELAVAVPATTASTATIADADEKAPGESTEKKQKGIGLSFARPRASSRASASTTNDEPDEDEAEKKRNRYAFVAAEVLSSDNWSIYEALMENQTLLRAFWSFLERPAPLDPLQASYFTKVNESLFDKKTDEMLDLLKSIDAAVPNMLRHVDCPMVMDLLLKIISLERTESGQGIVEWLYTKDVMPTLLSFLGPQHSWATQTSAGDFIKAIITVSANASQNEQACIGPNELTRQLVSTPCVNQLIGYMLGGGNPLTVGVGIVIEVIRKNNSDYDPDVGQDNNTEPSSRDPIYLGTLLRLFADRVPDFMSLILKAPTQPRRLTSTFGDKIEPLGFDRFKTCELMAELLHCSNMALLNEVGSEQMIKARDLERQRLRAKGHLGPNRGEDGPSVEDLTMRIRHSPPEDARRLEVTNASDDDGFEEVAPSGDMTEDTSHEFVQAEAEVSRHQTSRSLGKDGDDFVDEPLGSPRLDPQDFKSGDHQRFENPELVVAPLSPKKTTAEPSTLASENTAGRSDVGSGSSQSAANAEIQQKRIQDVVAAVDAEVDATAPGAIETPPASPGPTDAESKEGLFPANEVSQVPDVVPGDIAESTSARASEVVAPVSAPAEGATSTDKDAATSADISTSTQPVEPVVGDYLKMQFVEHRVVPTILSFFFTYPWNNFLHNVVYDIVQQVFNGPMDRGYNSSLAISLFEAADITNAIINGQAASEKSQAESKTRMGYMGHLTLIAEEVVKFTERNPPELLSELVLTHVMSPAWINYVEGALAETRERDNAILGGVRPEVAMSNRAAMAGNGLGGMGLSSLGLGGSQGGSTALAEAGLGGTGSSAEPDAGSGSSLGPFSISSGLLSGSGFGSSSDEEDEEEQDNDEDVNNEFRAYTDPQNASDSSMKPPSILPPPPPPPPLNIPPSRARLQLAARLAMHQKNAATPSAQSAEVEDFEDDDDAGRKRDEDEDDLRDPFGDDAAEDDEDSDDGPGTGDAESWNSASRGSWWRGALGRGTGEKFGDGRDDSDSDKERGEAGDADDDDEEFGDFAMPEVDKDASDTGVIVKPLPVHPPHQQGAKGSSPFTSLWPFGSKDKEKQRARDSEEGSAPDSLDEMTGDDGSKIKSTHEAKRRTSIEDPDDEEVVV